MMKGAMFSKALNALFASITSLFVPVSPAAIVRSLFAAKRFFEDHLTFCPAYYKTL
jgi:hypothetical protein